MAGKLFRYDTYDLRKFNTEYIKTFIDIGGNIGMVSIMARVLFPFARIVSIEPAKDTFELLKSNVKNLAIECYNEALGPGVPLWFYRQRFKGLHKFINDEEIKKWSTVVEYQTISKSLPDIIKSHKIDLSVPFILKVDCEGGEKYLRNDESIEVMKQAVQICTELHMGFGGTKKDFEEFLGKFKDSHNIYKGCWNDIHNKKNYKFIRYEGLEEHGREAVNLVSKKFEDECNI